MAKPRRFKPTASGGNRVTKARRDSKLNSLLTVVVATRNRRKSLMRTLWHLTNLPDQPRIIVVDDGSSDGSAAATIRYYPDIEVIQLNENSGAVARNIGVLASTTPFVAFADDDSWWAPGSLRQAVFTLQQHPAISGVVARAILEPSGETDKITDKLAADLNTDDSLPGPKVLSFPAFCVVLRRTAFEQIGGFSKLLFFGGEEQLLAIDLADADWPLCYIGRIKAHHQPDNEELSPRYWVLRVRNDILVSWMRRPWRQAIRATTALAWHSLSNLEDAKALLGVAWRLPAALKGRHSSNTA